MKADFVGKNLVWMKVNFYYNKSYNFSNNSALQGQSNWWKPLGGGQNASG